MRNRAWLLVPLLMLMGCVESQPPVVRVQPNVTRKSDLLGSEWYFLSTVVDVPYATDFTFVGEQGSMERIRWEVQEDYLVARRSYEYVAGSDPEGINGTTDSAGAVIAMYAITKHFDIRHEYNTVTGEQYNVIVENDQDRPWNEREYMRVDWSENLVQNPNFLMLQRYFDGLETEPVAWYVQDPNDPNAPQFVRQDAADEASPLAYMDITNKMFVRPTNMNIPGFGEFPSCLLLQFMDGNPVDCAPGEITVRHSFLRVDPDHDYQPFAYTGDRMDRFGYFVTERPGYDAAYGVVEPERYRFINRHNIWRESHKRDADGNFVMCTSDSECSNADPRGSRCDLDWGRARRLLTDDGHIQGACTIPFRDREIEPIVYYTSTNYPDDLQPEAQHLGSEYNEAFMEMVSSLRENECLSTGGTAESCAAERDGVPNVFFVCQSPVPEGAPEACGEPGTTVRIGDIRHSVLGWVSEPHRASPLGYGPSATDPLTGEIIAGNAYLYGAGVEYYSAFARDLVKLLNGDLTEEEVSAGAPVDAWVARMNGNGRGTDTAAANQHAVPVAPEDVARINAAMDFRWARSGSAQQGAASTPAERIQRVRDSFARLNSAGVFGDGTDRAGATLSRLQGTDIEQMMSTREMRAMAGIDPDLPVTPDVVAASSPLRSLRVDHLTAIARERAKLQQHAGLDYGDFADEGLIGLARAIVQAARNGETLEFSGVQYNVGSGGTIDYDAVRDMLRHPIMSGLSLHEVGHTVGFRHNFSGSFDAPNYAPRYWELRDDGDMHPRYLDPYTDAEVNGRILENAYSTVMDYGHNFVVTDSAGLGHYDHAAIKMGYADLVEVFEDVPDPQEVAWAHFIQAQGWPAPMTYDWAIGNTTGLEAYTYTDWPSLVGGRENLEHRADVPYESLTNTTLFTNSGIDFPVQDSAGRIAVPYRFCSDEQADLSPGCYRYDSGGDAYESVQSVIDSYWNYYIFNNFRRRRIGFNVRGTADRTLSRYFEKLQRANQTYALYRGVFQDAFDTGPDDAFWTNEHGMGGYTAAIGAAYQTLTHVVTAPEPGGYSRTLRGDGTSAYMPGGMEVRVDGYDGRYLETTWDFDAGYFWFDQLERVGYFYDKVLALMVLCDPTTYFIGRDTDSDIRRYQLNFASTFGPSITRLFGSLLGEDWNSISPRVNSGEVVYPDPLQIENGDMGGTPLSPNASFSIQLYAAVFGMALIPQTYDQDFLNRSRIWVRGGAEEVTIDPSLPIIEYTDEQSGLTYAAVSYEDGSGVEHGVGAQLLNRAIALSTRADAGDEQAAIELHGFIDNINLVRRLTGLLGFGAQP